MLRIEIYQDASCAWRWRGVDSSNRVIVTGAEGYIDFGGVERSLENVMTEFRGDVHVIRRNKRRTVLTAGRASDKPLHPESRPLDPVFDTIAEYGSEGAHV